jgi:chaperonin GroEL (HSP60 family)
VNIVKKAITEPLRMIAENAGEEGAIVLGKINDSKDNNFGEEMWGQTERSRVFRVKKYGERSVCTHLYSCLPSPPCLPMFS